METSEGILAAGRKVGTDQNWSGRIGVSVGRERVIASALDGGEESIVTEISLESTEADQDSFRRDLILKAGEPVEDGERQHIKQRQPWIMRRGRQPVQDRAVIGVGTLQLRDLDE